MIPAILYPLAACVAGGLIVAGFLCAVFCQAAFAGAWVELKGGVE